MISFLLCLAILIGGYFVYGKIVDNTFGPDDRETPAVRINDGVELETPTNLGSQIVEQSVKLFRRITDPALTVRRINLTANRVQEDAGVEQVDLFHDTQKQEKEKRLQQTMLDIRNRFGKNALLKASSYEEGATMRQRNGQIGGHKA